MHIRDLATIPHVISPHGEIIRELGGMSAGGLNQHSLAHITLPPGNASLKHYHPIAEESYYILSGTAEVIIEGQHHTLTAGQMVAIPSQQIHQIFNHSETEDVSFLAVCTPPWTPDCSVIVESK